MTEFDALHRALLRSLHLLVLRIHCPLLNRRHYDIPHFSPLPCFPTTPTYSCCAFIVHCLTEDTVTSPISHSFPVSFDTNTLSSETARVMDYSLSSSCSSSCLNQIDQRFGAHMYCPRPDIIPVHVITLPCLGSDVLEGLSVSQCLLSAVYQGPNLNATDCVAINIYTRLPDYHVTFAPHPHP